MSQAVPKWVVPSHIPSEMGQLLISGRTQTCQSLKLMPKHSEPASISLRSVMDESKCLPRGVLSFTGRRSLPSSILKAAIFSLLAICPQRPLFDNNHPQRVCQLFEKLTSISDCTYYLHLGLLEQLCLRSKQDCDIFSLPVEVVSQHRALCSVSHSGGRAAFGLGCTLLHLGNYIQTAPMF